MLLRIRLDVSPLGHAMRALDDNLDATMAKAMADAGDMVSDRARSFHDYTDRSFDLTGSIHAEPVTGSFTAGNLTVAIVADTPYAKFIEEGTGEHPIRARRSKALRFRGRDGRYVFRRSVNHPGTKPRWFLRNARDATFPQAVKRSEQGAVEAFRRAGFEIA